MTRIESHATAIGFPDLAYCWKGHNGHIELKYVWDENDIMLRPAQHRWLSDNVAAGGHPLIVTGISGHDGSTRIMIHHGNQSRDLITNPSHDEWICYSKKIWDIKNLTPGEMLQIMEKPWLLK